MNVTLLDEASPRRKGITGKNNAPVATPGHVSRDAVWIGYRLALVVFSLSVIWLTGG